MSIQDFEFLSSLIRNKSGINLEEDKIYLIESRLQPVAKKYSLKSVQDVINEIKNNQNENLIYDTIEALTTNETLFFRDIKVFDQLKSYILPRVLEGKTDTLRVWSAACSTGQEPYSIAMSLIESPLMKDKTFEILATDISKKVLEKSEKGEYSQFEVQRGLPVTLLMRYFDNNEEVWNIQDQIKKYIKFQYFNLIEDFNQIQGQFDIICCRNVLIYFTNEIKVKILTAISQKLSPKGVLILGCYENNFGAENVLSPVPEGIGLYIKK